VVSNDLERRALCEHPPRSVGYVTQGSRLPLPYSPIMPGAPEHLVRGSPGSATGGGTWRAGNRAAGAQHPNGARCVSPASAGLGPRAWSWGAGPGSGHDTRPPQTVMAVPAIAGHRVTRATLGSAPRFTGRGCHGKPLRVGFGFSCSLDPRPSTLDPRPSTVDSAVLNGHPCSSMLTPPVLAAFLRAG
jgi:hypothetical protein